MTKAVGIRDLKTHLSQHLREVQAGTVVTVTDHGRPIAEIRAIPEPESSEEAILRQMAAEGALTLPTGDGKLVPHEPIRVRGDVSASELIWKDREERF